MSFWVGRLTAENIRVEANGRRKFYGEFAYLKSDDTEIRSFIGLAKNMTADDLQGAAIVNHIFGRDYMGIRYGGVGIGRLLRETTEGTEALGGGKIYGVDRDMHQDNHPENAGPDPGHGAEPRGPGVL
jgi:hypothetical protein